MSLSIPLRSLGSNRYLAPAVAIIALALVIRLVFALTVPPWQSPDEPKHFEHVRLLVDKAPQLWTKRRLLNVQDVAPALQTEIIASMATYHYFEYTGGLVPNPLPRGFADLWQGSWTTLHRPSLYYFLAAPTLYLFRQADLERQLVVVRIFSAVLSAATAGVTYLCARRLANGDPFIPLVSGVFVATLPMHVAIGGAVNNDNLITLLGAIFFLVVTDVILSRGLRWRAALPFAVLPLALLTKRSAAALVPAALFAIAWIALAWGRRWRLAVTGALLSGAGAAAVAVSAYPSLVRNAEGLVIAQALNESNQFDRFLNTPLGSPEVQALTLRLLGLLFRSFWGIFGWYKAPLGEITYQVLAVVTALVALGLLAALASGAYRAVVRNALPIEKSAALGLFAGSTLLVIAMSVGERLPYLYPLDILQARYLFIAITPIAILFAAGARVLLPRGVFGTTIPMLSCVLGLVVLDVVAYTGTILPFFVWRSF